MSQHLRLHAKNPEVRHLKTAAEILKKNGVIVLPTDSGYSLVTKIDNKSGFDRIVKIRAITENHPFTLLCRNLSDIAHYAKVDNIQYRLLKAATPGAFTFILQASPELPKRLSQSKRKTIGIRISNSVILQSFFETYDEPLLSSSLTLPDDELELFNDIELVYSKVKHGVDLFLSAEEVTQAPTTILDLSEGMPPTVVRQGQADASAFL